VSWKRVKGHERVVQAFRRVVQRDRLAHAYLFAGPAGVGKRLFALELAHALLCENSPPNRLEACDLCPACALVQAGNHPDLFVAGRLEDSLELRIKTVREFRENFALKPARGHGKVAILDDADFMNEEAANCLLKTLEEPPPRSVLILIGTSPDLQLSTIVSRCQVVHFSPLPHGVMMEVLRANSVHDPSMLPQLVRQSGGSPGQALALADPALWEFRRAFLRDLSHRQPDGVALARKWMQFVEEAGKESAAQRRRAAAVLQLVIAFFKDAFTLSVGAAVPNIEAGEQAALRDLAGRLGPDQWLELLERCLKADEQIDRRVQLVLVLEALLDALGQQLTAHA
jgi:DNA polymerase-3 subunit delta'